MIPREELIRMAKASASIELNVTTSFGDFLEAYGRAVESAVSASVTKACIFLCEEACLDIGFKGLEAIDAAQRTRDAVAAAIRARGTA